MLVVWFDLRLFRGCAWFRVLIDFACCPLAGGLCFSGTCVACCVLACGMLSLFGLGWLWHTALFGFVV